MPEPSPAADPSQVPTALDLCLRMGEILMSNGAGAADVTVTMRALATAFGMHAAEIDVTFTSLAMSFQSSPDAQPVSMIRQVKQREIDYEDLTRADHLVRAVMAGEVGLADARAEAGRIASSGHQTPRWAVSAAWGVMCAGVALMLGGTPVVMAIAAVAAMTIDRLQVAMSRRRLPLFYQQVVGGGVATLLAAASTALGWAVSPSLVITASIIMLLSGVGFMGALQDALSGFYVTASARLIEALLATAGIIAGVSGGIAAAEVLGVDLGTLTPGRAIQLDTLLPVAGGAALAAASFAVAAYSPWRAVLPVGLVAGVAMLISQGVRTAGFDRTWGVGVAALMIGLVAYGVGGRFRVPPLVVAVSAIVPLLPGLTIYRGLSLLSETGAETRGLLALITAASVALALAAGVILGEYVAQPLKREARRLETRLSGPRLVGPIRIRSASRGLRGSRRDSSARH